MGAVGLWVAFSSRRVAFVEVMPILVLIISHALGLILGLIVGRSAAGFAGVPAAWSGYFGQGAAPCLANFRFLGRAITPPMRHKRFDARFFMADADDALIDDRPPIDGRELADLRWFTLPEVAQLDLPNVTRFVIAEVEARLVKREALKPFHLYWTQDGHVRERLG